MSRRNSILGLAAVAILVALGLKSWGLAQALVERHVVAGIEKRVGLKVTSLKRAEIAFLPMPRVSLSEVSFGAADGTLSGTALRLRARARLLSLVGGQLDFDRVDLIGPEIDIAVPGEPENYGNWVAPPLAYLAALTGETRLVISSGSLMARSGNTILTTLRDVNLVIEEREEAEPVAFAGSFTWRGEPTKVNLLWPVTGERSRIALAVSSNLLSFRLNGARTAAQGVTTGQVEFTSRSLPDALAWIGPRPRIATLVRQVELTAEAQLAGDNISLSNVIAKLDGDQLEGALKIDGGGARRVLSGTLAGADFDLARLFRQGGYQKPPGTGEPGETPLEFDSWTAHDVDLRVSLDAARLGSARLGELAAQLMVRKGRFEAAILRASAYGGVARAKLLATAVPSGAEVKLQAGLDRVNLGQAGADLPELLGGLTGFATGQIALDGTGDSLEQVVGSLTGRANASLRQGEFKGVAFAELLRRTEKPPAAREWRHGKTSFEIAQFAALANRGVLTLTEAQMTGPGFTLSLSGSADLGRRWLELTGLLSAANGSARTPLEIRGPFNDAVFTPTFEATFHPTGSISPLGR
ncbi:MAG: AsmA family protein [Bosea sp.]|uniref:AsmA family protein n=1 Tax=Bosea sp. (in: a-proteobacteria) TaxID=1871050 RepID=UPI001ACC5A19|nr:AsmA-like C-terminal region-containing protein [Bosea sp. (in: a-proteobacteria)]MBN9471811.1 AsmA family protein [Bosea sp. (in: a-proteobacteria)]